MKGPANWDSKTLGSTELYAMKLAAPQEGLTMLTEMLTNTVSGEKL